jgi:hypothetical protein
MNINTFNLRNSWSRLLTTASILISAARLGSTRASASRSCGWIDAVTLKTRIHRDPSSESYRYKGDFGPNDRLVPDVSEALAVTLAELELH